MARLSRFSLAGESQHVIQRGNNRQRIFFDETDHRFFLDRLNASAVKHDCDIHAYVLMPDHIHLLVTPRSEGGIGKMMQMLGRYYVRHYNDRYRRSGTLWEGRYKATLIDSRHYLLTCMRYIELNPVRAGLVEHPVDYRWSSYQHNALDEAGELITPHDEYCRLADNPDGCRNRYRQLFDHRISENTLAEIREATNKAWVLGSGLFKSKIEHQLARRVSPAQRGGDRKSAAFTRTKTG